MACALLHEFDRMEQRNPRCVYGEGALVAMRCPYGFLLSYRLQGFTRGTVLIFLPGMPEIEEMDRNIKRQCERFVSAVMGDVSPHLYSGPQS